LTRFFRAVEDHPEEEGRTIGNDTAGMALARGRRK
jgi:hypothetical protein